MRTLEQITAEAVAIYKQGETSYRRWGKLMNRAKKLVPRGGWLKYLKTNFPEISERQAQKYMELARDKTGTKTLEKINTRPSRHKMDINERSFVNGENVADGPEPKSESAPLSKDEQISRATEAKRKAVQKLVDSLDPVGLMLTDQFIRNYKRHIKYVDPDYLKRKTHQFKVEFPKKEGERISTPMVFWDGSTDLESHPDGNGKLD